MIALLRLHRISLYGSKYPLLGSVWGIIYYHFEVKYLLRQRLESIGMYTTMEMVTPPDLNRSSPATEGFKMENHQSLK